MLEDADKLVKKINAINDAMRNQIVISAVKRGTQIVRAEAVLMCPVNSGELRNSIKTMTEKASNEVNGYVYTNKSYAPYVEFGTGPTGQENHSGISPEITPVYSAQGWSYKDDDGNWIYTNGQAAQPFMYPALKNNEKKVITIVKNDITEQLERLV